MHIPDGALCFSAQGIGVLCAGAGVTAAGTYLGLRRLDYEKVPQVAMLSAAFLVASTIQVPIGLSSAHLVLNGLVGLLLGWAAFPALLIALFVQALLFGFGGFLALGVNTTSMALPAVVAYGLFHRGSRARSDATAFASGFGAGAVGVLLGAALASTMLWAAGEELSAVSLVFFLTHAVLAVTEGLVTASVVLFLRRVRPALLEAPLWAPGSR